MVNPSSAGDRHRLASEETILTTAEVDEWLKHTRSKSLGTKMTTWILCQLANRLSNQFAERHIPGEEPSSDAQLWLETTIYCLSKASSNIPETDPHYGDILYKLGGSLELKYNTFGWDVEDIDDAFAAHWGAMEVRPHDHPKRAASLSRLAVVARDRYSKTDNAEHLKDAITLHREALSLLPPHDDDRAGLVDGLISLLGLQDPPSPSEDPGETIALHQNLLLLLSENDPKRLDTLLLLADSLQTRFETSGEANDLEAAVKSLRDAFTLSPPGHSHRAAVLAGLAEVLYSRHKASDRLNDLEEAASLFEDSLSDTQIEHPDKASTLFNLANVMKDLFSATGRKEHLDKAIQCHQDALILPPNISTRLEILSNGGVALHTRYKAFGNINDLEDAIMLLREASSTSQEDNSEKSTFDHNLATVLQARYDRLGEAVDLDKAIELYRTALTRRPLGHQTRHSTLSSLATALTMRWEVPIGPDIADKGEQEEKDRQEKVKQRKEKALELKAADLSEAIQLHEEALSFLPEDHPHRTALLINYAISLDARAEASGNMEHHDEAIKEGRKALSSLPKEHSRRLLLLHNLAAALGARHKRFGKPEDLDDAIILEREAINLAPPHNPDRSVFLHGLANLLEASAELDEAKVDEIQKLATEAVDDPYRKVFDRLKWARQWTKLRSASPQFHLLMHTKCLHLLQQLLVINPDITKQERLLQEVDLQDLATDAAEAAIPVGDLEQAISLLEMGRSVLLATLGRYRTPLDKLRPEHEDLAKELSDVGSRLESLAMECSSTDVMQDSVSLDHAFRTQRRLLSHWDSIIAKIRGFDGFKYFLASPSYSELQGAAKDGPVVFLVAGAERCYAIIMYHSGPPTLVDLPNVSFMKLSRHYKKLFRSQILVEKAMTRETGRRDLIAVLECLWEDVVSPIVDVLIRTLDCGSRIWWCPTSLFVPLPIHAAGRYPGPYGRDFFRFDDQPVETSDTVSADAGSSARDPQRSITLSEHYISSYTTTAADLLRSISYDRSSVGDQSPPINGARTLFVSHTGDPPLELAEELRHVRSVLGQDVVPLEQQAATPEAVVQQIPLYPRIHMACHGVAEGASPLDSYFQLEGDNLRVRDISKLRLKNAELAYLSTCDNAAGGPANFDESIHLVAGLQLAGFRSVVGSMWSVFDAEGPELAKDFYQKLKDLGGGYNHAAEALHYAIGRCRERCELPEEGGIPQGPERWAMYIHVGA